MDFFVQLMELVAVFVPDFFTFGLVGSAFFSPFCIGKMFDLVGTLETQLALGMSFALAYLVTINRLQEDLYGERQKNKRWKGA